VSTGLDGVFATLHVGSSGGSTMSISRVGAGSAGMHTVKAETVCPTVKHLDTIVCDDMWHPTALGAWHGHSCFSRADGAGSIGTVQGRFITDMTLSDACCSAGTVVAELHHCELAEAFFVFVSEVHSKLDQGLVSNRSDAPGVVGSAASIKVPGDSGCPDFFPECFLSGFCKPT